MLHIIMFVFELLSIETMIFFCNWKVNVLFAFVASCLLIKWVWNRPAWYYLSFVWANFYYTIHLTSLINFFSTSERSKIFRESDVQYGHLWTWHVMKPHVHDAPRGCRNKHIHQGSIEHHADIKRSAVNRVSRLSIFNNTMMIWLCNATEWSSGVEPVREAVGSSSSYFNSLLTHWWT